MSLFSVTQIQQQQDQARTLAWLAVGAGLIGAGLNQRRLYASLAQDIVLPIALPNAAADAANAMTPGETECLQEIGFVAGHARQQFTVP